MYKEEEINQIQEGINMIEHKLIGIYKNEGNLLNFVSEEYSKWIVFL